MGHPPDVQTRPAADHVPMSAHTWWRLVAGPQRDLEQGRAPHAHGQTLTIRHATPDDTVDLERLAELDGRRPPRGVVLLADVDGELWAAVSLDDDHLIADPFRPSGELAFLVAQRARAIRRAEQGRMGRLPRVWPEQPFGGPRFAH
jgi:hypothetical protein